MTEAHRNLSADPWRVLVWPGGTEVGLEIHKSLAWAKEVELVSAGAFGGGHAPYVFANHVDLVHVDDPGWLDALIALIETHRIDVVMPAHDDAVLALAEHASALPAIALAPRVAVARLCRSKLATHEALCDVVPMPRLFDPATETVPFPVFARPDVGQGSQGAMLVEDEIDLAFALSHGSDVVTSLLSGRECTVDCFSTATGLVYSLARSRDRVRNGISVSSAPVRDQDRFGQMAQRIHAELGIRGAWFFQTREDAEGLPHLLEVAPRIAGTMSVSRLRGVNLPLLAIFDAFDVPVCVDPLGIDVRVDRALAERVAPVLQPSRVYVDLDDTLVLRGRVNSQLVMVLASLRSRGVSLELVTRHRAVPEETLASLGLGSIFHRIHHLTEGQPKSSVVTGTGAVFIDDSFAERREVAAATNAVPLDSSMLALLDDGRN